MTLLRRGFVLRRAQDGEGGEAAFGESEKALATDWGMVGGEGILHFQKTALAKLFDSLAAREPG